MHELVRSLNAMKGQENAKLSHLYHRIGAGAVETRATESERSIRYDPEHRRCDGNIPVLINSLVGLFQRVHGGSFTEAQIQTLLLTNAVTNASAWAVAFHTALALKEGLDPADVNAIREGRAPGDRQHAALSTLAKTLIEKRGRLDDQDVDQFTGAGFRKDLVLEVIAVVAASTITNYTGSVTKPPVEAPFRAYMWNK
jgi:hypothetical protein